MAAALGPGTSWADDERRLSTIAREHAAVFRTHEASRPG